MNEFIHDLILIIILTILFYFLTNCDLIFISTKYILNLAVVDSFNKNLIISCPCIDNNYIKLKTRLNTTFVKGRVPC